MTPDELRAWLGAIGGLLTPLIAVLAVMIARRQHVVQRQKLMLALFEKRYGIYLETMKLISKVVQIADSSTADVWTFDFGTSGSQFLFGSDVNDYLRQLRNNAIDLEYRNKEYSRLIQDLEEPTVTEERKRKLPQIIERKSELLRWFGDQLTRTESIFSPYLDFSMVKEARRERGHMSKVRSRKLRIVTGVGAFVAALAGSVSAFYAGCGYHRLARTQEPLLVVTRVDHLPTPLTVGPKRVTAFVKNVGLTPARNLVVYGQMKRGTAALAETWMKIPMSSVKPVIEKGEEIEVPAELPALTEDDVKDLQSGRGRQSLSLEVTVGYEDIFGREYDPQTFTYTYDSKSGRWFGGWPERVWPKS